MRSYSFPALKEKKSTERSPAKAPSKEGEQSDGESSDDGTMERFIRIL